MASGDWNISASELEKSCLLDGFGLAIIFPTNGKVACTHSAEGTLLDYSVITKAYLPLVRSCEIVSCVPCATRNRVRATFYASPENITVKKLRRPNSLDAAAEHFDKHGKLVKGIAITTWEFSHNRLYHMAGGQVYQHRSPKVDAYVESVGLAERSLKAAYDLSHWSCCAEYRLLAGRGIDVNNTSLSELAPFTGRGQLPTLEYVPLLDLAGKSKSAELAAQLAWHHQDGEAFGKDLHVLNASGIRQLYRRFVSGHGLNSAERDFIDNVLSSKGRAVCHLAEMVLGNMPASDDPEEWACEATKLAEHHRSSLV